MATHKIILVLGAGPRIGLSTVKKFAAQGFKTAAACRTPTEELTKTADLVIQADFSEPESIAGIFEQVKAKFGGAPEVVVYNAYAFPQGQPFEISVPEFTKGLNINAISPYAALSEAIKGFKTLPQETLKTFIYTGNAAPHIVMPPYLQLTLGKRVVAYMLENAILAFKEEGFRFYFADERTAEAAPTYNNVDGPGHAEFYYELATKKEQTHDGWEQTFVSGKGYVDFEGKVGEIPTN